MAYSSNPTQYRPDIKVGDILVPKSNASNIQSLKVTKAPYKGSLSSIWHVKGIATMKSGVITTATITTSNFKKLKSNGYSLF